MGLPSARRTQTTWRGDNGHPKMVGGLEHLHYEEKVRETAPRSWETLLRPLILKRGLEERWRETFYQACSDRARSDSFKLREGRLIDWI